MNKNSKIVALLLAMASLIFLFSCSPKTNSSLVEEGNHIHSLAFDPTEGEIMYLATHYYLEKINLKTGEKQRFSQGQDYMGFVITSDGTFYASGHSPQVANVGIRKSTDKGKTWTTLAYEGVDFHDMAISYANPKVIYAWSTPPEEFLTVSMDGGEIWEKVLEMNGLQGSIFALEADEQQPEKLYAGTLFGLFISEDGGKNWVGEDSLKSVPIVALVDDPLQEGKLTVATADKILQTVDGGKTWQGITGNFNQKEEMFVFLTTDLATEKAYGVTKHSKVYVFEKGNSEEEKEWRDFSLKK